METMVESQLLAKSDNSDADNSNYDDQGNHKDIVSEVNAEPTEDIVLGISKDKSDVVLEVEGRRLHASRAVLAHYSPVFDAMFFSSFKESCQSSLPLPGKKHSDMVLFFRCMLSRSITDPVFLADADLLGMLTLADEYQVDEVKAKCQSYIGEQLLKTHRRRSGFPKSYLMKLPLEVYPPQFGMTKKRAPRQINQTSVFGSHVGDQFDSPSACASAGVFVPQVNRINPRISQFMLYLRVCAQFGLCRFTEYIIELLVDEASQLDDLVKEEHYYYVTSQGKVPLLEAFCRKQESNNCK